MEGGAQGVHPDSHRRRGTRGLAAPGFKARAWAKVGGTGSEARVGEGLALAARG